MGACKSTRARTHTHMPACVISAILQRQRHLQLHFTMHWDAHAVLWHPGTRPLCPHAHFPDAWRSLSSHNRIYAATCESQLVALSLQRSILISGASIFLFFVMRRLLDIQGQLFTTRQLAKEAAAQQALLLGGGSNGSGGGSTTGEHHERLAHTLSRLQHAASGAAPASGGRAAAALAASSKQA